MLKVKALLLKLLQSLPTSSGVTVTAGTGFRVEDVNVTKIGSFISGSMRVRSTTTHAGRAWTHIATISAKPRANCYFPALIFDHTASDLNTYLGNELQIQRSDGKLLIFPILQMDNQDLAYVQFSYRI